MCREADLAFNANRDPLSGREPEGAGDPGQGMDCSHRYAALRHDIGEIVVTVYVDYAEYADGSIWHLRDCKSYRLGSQHSGEVPALK